jgi:polyisoprenoid-binding protein YceI
MVFIPENQSGKVAGASSFGSLRGHSRMVLSKCALWVGMLLMAFVAAARLAPVVHAQRTAAPEKRSEKPALKPGDIDVEKSRIYVLVGKKGLGHEHGVEGKIKSGAIDLGAAKDPGAIEFDMVSFAADTDEARKSVELKGTIGESTRDKVTRTMLGPEVLDVEEFPTATFKIKTQEMRKGKKEGDSVVLKGDFTLHGQTQPLSITAKLERTKSRSHLSGSFTILQSDFGITPYKAALGAVGVTDELKIVGDLWIVSEETKR